MLMSDLAIRELESRRDSFVDRCRWLVVAVFGRSSTHRLPEIVAQRQLPQLRTVPAGPPAPLRVVNSNAATSMTPEVDKRWQRHPQLRTQQSSPVRSMAGQRAARLEAERGMILARGGKLADAVEAFTTAAEDPAVDLSILPGFWDMPRRSMMTAVRAYEAVDRLRDASALEARIRHTLRPRALKPVPSGSGPGRMSASGD